MAETGKKNGIHMNHHSLINEMKTDGLILAGGKNSRMGGQFKGNLIMPESSKGRSPEEGEMQVRHLDANHAADETILTHLLKEFSVCSDIWISCGSSSLPVIESILHHPGAEDTPRPETQRSIPADNLRPNTQRSIPADHLLPDLYPGCGPMAGIHAGLLASRSEWMAVCACDMPFLTWEFYRHLIDHLSQPGTTPWDGIVPTLHGRKNPLAAIYHRRTISAWETCLKSGDYKIALALSQLHILYVELEDYPELAHMLENINTPEDYQRVKRDGSF